MQAAVWAGAEAVRRGRPLRLVQVYALPQVKRADRVRHHEQVRAGLAERAEGWLAEARDAVLAEHPGPRNHHGGPGMEPGHRADPGVAARRTGRARLPRAGRVHRPARRLDRGRRGRARPLPDHRGPRPDAPGPAADTGPVVVGADGSPDSDAALAFACEEARLRGTGLTAVHTWSDILADGMLRPHPLQENVEEIEQTERAKLAEQVGGWQEKYPDLKIELDVTRGRPVRTLLERGEHAQLIVVGCRGRGGFTGMLLGSTSQALIAHSPCPVAVVRPQGSAP